MPHLYLIGMPGAGKSTVGKLLAEELGLPFIDLDEEIEKTAGATIPEIFEAKGEDFFRQLEAVTLKTVSFSAEKLVIATGGGTPCFHANMAFMNANGLTIYLKTDPETLAERLWRTDLVNRPLLKNQDKLLLLSHLQETLSRRGTFYEQAGIIFEEQANTASPAEIAGRLLAFLDRYNRTA